MWGKDSGLVPKMAKKERKKEEGKILSISWCCMFLMSEGMGKRFCIFGYLFFFLFFFVTEDREREREKGPQSIKFLEML